MRWRVGMKADFEHCAWNVLFSKTSSSFLAASSRKHLKIYMPTSPEVPLLFSVQKTLFWSKIRLLPLTKKLVTFLLKLTARPTWWLSHYLIIQLVFLPDDNWLQAVSSWPQLSCLQSAVKGRKKKKKDILLRFYKAWKY